jgi:hypothetical protein
MKYFVDVYFYNCPKCSNPVIGTKYYHLRELAEMGAAKMAGLINYTCPFCGDSRSSANLLANGHVDETSESEALANGLAVESKGSA